MYLTELDKELVAETRTIRSYRRDARWMIAAFTLLFALCWWCDFWHWFTSPEPYPNESNWVVLSQPT